MININAITKIPIRYLCDFFKGFLDFDELEYGLEKYLPAFTSFSNSEKAIYSLLMYPERSLYHFC